MDTFESILYLFILTRILPVYSDTEILKLCKANHLCLSDHMLNEHERIDFYDAFCMVLVLGH